MEFSYVVKQIVFNYVFNLGIMSIWPHLASEICVSTESEEVNPIYCPTTLDVLTWKGDSLKRNKKNNQQNILTYREQQIQSKHIDRLVITKIFYMANQRKTYMYIYNNIATNLISNIITIILTKYCTNHSYNRKYPKSQRSCKYS